MIELNDLYDYGLKIYQNKGYFKFSLDSILLAEFVDFHPHDTILDLCTGNAPIPLILSTKSDHLHIDGIELQHPIYELALKSVQINGLEDRIAIIQDDAATYRSDIKYGIVTCNPPYFKNAPSSQKNVDKIKMLARHEVAIDLAQIVISAKNNLKEDGTFYLVHRCNRFIEVLEELKKNKFGIRKIAFIRTKKGKRSEFFLVEASKYKKDDPIILQIDAENLQTYKNIFKGGN